MRSVLTSLLLLAFVFAVAAPLRAEDVKEKKEVKKPAVAKAAEAMQAVHQELMNAVMAVLTDEQKQALKPQKRPAGEKPARKKEPRPEKKPAKAPAP